MFRVSWASLALLATLLGSQADGSVLSEDPFPGLSGTFLSNEFMQLDSVSPQNLHTGVDIGASSNATVYPPIPVGKTIKIQAIGSDWLLAQGTEAQGSDIAAFVMVHLTPNGNLQVGSTIGPSTPLGTLIEADLHLELYLSPNTQITNEDLVNPRLFGFENAGWIVDTQKPVIDETTVHDNQNPIVWQIRAHDTNDGEPAIYNGIFAMQLYIDANLVDEFQFTQMTKKDGTYPPNAAEYYYCTTCYPSGNNNPNVLEYKLSWAPTDQNEHVWRLAWWDGMLNYDEGDPTNPPAEPGGEMGGEIRDGRVYLSWRVYGGSQLHHFDVLASAAADSGFLAVNNIPIPVIAGQRDYEFAADLPPDWETIWYRIVGTAPGGEQYIIGQMDLDLGVPVLSSITTRPNPTSFGVEFSLTLSQEDDGVIEVFDSGGRRVRTLRSGALAKGRQSGFWDGRDEDGRRVATGLYFLRVETKREREVLIHKVTLVH